MFIVYGDFNKTKVRSLFSKYLIPHSNQKITYDCFTHQPSFSFIPYQKDTYSVILGFPCDTMIPYKELCEDIVNTLLFNNLRTMHKLVYGIKSAFVNTQCNTYVCIEFDVSLEKVKETIQRTIDCLLLYKKQSITPVILSSSKRRSLYKYRTTYDFMDYYSDNIFSSTLPRTMHQLIEHNNKFTENYFKSMMNTVFEMNKAICVYQGKKDLHLSWNSFRKV